jgi:hypothetical protein
MSGEVSNRENIILECIYNEKIARLQMIFCTLGYVRVDPPLTDLMARA